MTQASGSAESRNKHPLDWLNFLLADVTDGLNPFLAMYLLSVQHWTPERIGFAMSLSGIANVVVRAPIGRLIDATQHKRELVAGAAIAIGLCAVALSFLHSFPVVAGLQIVVGTAGSFAAALPAITLGIVGQKAYARRLGRNEAFNHGGNAMTAVASGIAGMLVAQVAVLWAVAALAALSAVAAMSLRADDIDHDVARGGAETASNGLAGLKTLLANRTFLIFCAALTLFQFANTGMLPLVAEKLAGKTPHDASLFIAGCIVVAQAVMVPTAILAGRKADRWGRKPMLLAAFAVLPVRGLLFMVATGPAACMAIQTLDGFAAGFFFVLYLVMTDDLTRGTGTYNLAVGIVSAAFGLGQSLSNLVAGRIVTMYGSHDVLRGYDSAFLFMAGCAVVALLVFLLAMPETLNWPGAKKRLQGAPEHLVT